MAGLDSSGYTTKTTEAIKADLESGFRAVFGAAISVIAQSVFGQLIGIVADRLSELWQLGLAIYTGSFREGATGVQLDNIGALTGTYRRAASYTTVSLTLTGTNGTVITAGRLVKQAATGVQFTNDVGGTFSGTSLVLEFRAFDTGPITAVAGTVDTIVTPVSGWTSVTNPLDHDALGADIESDAAYRLRQVAELRGQGASTVAAIRAKVSALTGVTDCFVFENVGDVTDANGLPPHTFETVVDGGTDADIAKVVSDNKPVGIGTYGSTATATTDANGFAVTMNYSRPANLNIYIVINQTADASEYPVNGDDLVKAAVAAYGDLNYRMGSEVRSSALIGAIFGATVGVLETTLPLIGLAPSPGSSATLTVNNRQRAKLDTSRITVNTTLIVPS